MQTSMHCSLSSWNKKSCPFVRKYFPVVYSCRFAELSGGRGKVLEPEMQLKTAFFEEHHPEALDRLETYTEIGLFDML